MQTETEEYRGYRLVATRELLRWRVTFTASRLDLPPLAAPSRFNLDRALDDARRLIDRALG